MTCRSRPLRHVHQGHVRSSASGVTAGTSLDALAGGRGPPSVLDEHRDRTSSGPARWSWPSGLPRRLEFLRRGARRSGCDRRLDAIHPHEGLAHRLADRHRPWLQIGPLLAEILHDARPSPRSSSPRSRGTRSSRRASGPLAHRQETASAWRPRCRSGCGWDDPVQVRRGHVDGAVITNWRGSTDSRTRSGWCHPDPA